MLGSMETPAHERREIEEYLRSQSGPDFEIEHVEKLTSEYVLGDQYDVWDAHTNEGRWWVITNPTTFIVRNKSKAWMWLCRSILACGLGYRVAKDAISWIGTVGSAHYCVGSSCD